MSAREEAGIRQELVTRLGQFRAGTAPRGDIAAWARAVAKPHLEDYATEMAWTAAWNMDMRLPTGEHLFRAHDVGVYLEWLATGPVVTELSFGRMAMPFDAVVERFKF